MQILNGVMPLKNEFEYFIIDIWGVVYDGHGPCPGAIQALECLKGTSQVILTGNTPIEHEKLAERLESEGIVKNLYDSILTSGSIAIEWLATKGKYLGHFYYLLSAKSSSPFYNLKSHARTDYINGADFVIMDSFPDEDAEKVEVAKILKIARSKELVFVCPNPDLKSFLQHNDIELDLNRYVDPIPSVVNHVIYFDKPHPPIYEIALARMGNPKPEQVCAIGDGLLTDIKGANDNDFFSVWVLMQQKTLANNSVDYFEKICKKHHVIPNAILPHFIP